MYCIRLATWALSTIHASLFRPIQSVKVVEACKTANLMCVHCVGQVMRDKVASDAGGVQLWQRDSDGCFSGSDLFQRMIGTFGKGLRVVTGPSAENVGIPGKCKKKHCVGKI